MNRMFGVLIVSALLLAIGSAVTVDVPDGVPDVVEAMVTTGAAAQNGNGGGGGLTCGWCEEDVKTGFWELEGGGVVYGTYLGHRFPDGGDECGFPPGEECSRCGGTSDCHQDWQTALPNGQGCHIECGPGGGDNLLAAVTANIDEMLRTNNVDGVVRIARSTSLVRISPDGRELVIAAACGSADAPTVRAIPSSLGARIAARLVAARRKA